MKKTVFILLIVLIMAIATGLVAYEAITEKTVSSSTAVRAGLLLVALASTLIRTLSGSRQGKKQSEVYKAQYKDVIRSAFSKPEDKKQLDKLLRAIAYFNKDDSIAKALNELNELLPLCKTNDEYCAVYTFLALSYEELFDEDEQIIEYYEKVLEYDETRSSIWSNLGRIYENIGKNEQAIDCLEKAIYYDNENSYAYHNLATAYYRVGEYDKTVEYDKIALDKNGKLYQAAAMLCLVYHQLGNSEESDRYFRIAVANGQNAESLRAAKESCFTAE